MVFGMKEKPDIKNNGIKMKYTLLTRIKGYHNGGW